MVKAVLSMLLNFAYLLSFIVPKRKDVWLFSAWNGRSYSDNSKYLYKYVLATRPAIRAFWVAKDPALYLSMTSQGLPCVYAYSLKGVYFQLIAGVLFFSHCVDWEFCSYLIAPRAKRIQLWHGMPIKHIGYDDSLNQQSSMKSALIKFMLPFRSEAFDFIIALGQRDKAIYQSAFQIRPEKVRVTGFPRNDASVRKRSQEEKSVLDILYLPTFRGVPGSEFGLFSEEGFVFQEVDNWLNERHCKLHIKLHPVNKLASRDLQQIHLSHNIALFDESDIYEKLHLFDVFVTDFSSVYFDCLVTGKPIILAPIKLNDYLKKERGGFYFSPSELAFGSICSNWCEVFAEIDGVLKQRDRHNGCQALQESFHRYLDGASSERVCQEVERLLAKS